MSSRDARCHDPRFEELARRFEAKGYVVRRYSHLSNNGIWVVFQRQDGVDGLWILEASVELYDGERGLEACVIKHATDWIKNAASIEELEAVGVHALTTPRAHDGCPGEDWTELR